MSKLKIKERKQFHLHDIYRYAAIGETSNIKGIMTYECNRDATTLKVVYEDKAGQTSAGIPQHYFARNEEELKQIVKCINKALGNCIKPGRKRRAQYVAQ